ncbi:sulfotransferase-like domain-containing protein [Paraglaciecola hydrolytica]|uniref:Branched-chain amino acid aminotransferase n=1 Tax=Paraglaciecola hydrolytica TaxID=1799789 RepID=A0A148KMU5_9ALTE|nr:hypothetical protein [Paraglaciecola hydrolytica]KXI27636.1 hypothetical protein AX660_18940 [Paraglaciecola hydrolytica]
MTIRIAMWSGPRNISTAMMRSFENRADTLVVDEPFYAFYLSQTNSPHPMFDEVIVSQSQDYAEVVSQLTQANQALAIEYQKHMTHHMLQGVDMHWTKQLKNCFLIREPKEVVQSYTQSRGVCSAEDIGIIRQLELYHEISALSEQPVPVIEGKDILAAPQDMLSKLCEALGIPFDSNMLHWPTGLRDSDGVWAPHWYHSVANSRGFAAASSSNIQLSPEQQRVVDEVTPAYEYLRQLKIQAE